MTISAAMVKELRIKTGAGIMDAKKALVGTNGDIEAAVDWLRAKGVAKAAKKTGRTTAEGQIGVVVEARSGALVEVNSETDFVAKNNDFCAFVKNVAKTSISAKDLDELMASKMGEGSVADGLSSQIAALGENMAISRLTKICGDNITSYVHNQAEPGVGKIGVLVAFEGNDNDGMGRKIAMHVAASSPISLSEEDAPSDRIERERQVLSEIAKSTGKPAAIIEKIVDGGMRKFFQNETLLNQKFVMNPDISVKQAAAEAGIKITGFSFMKVGEQAE